MAAKDNDDRKSDNSDADISLDMSQAAVKKMIGEARERGYITYDQLNQVLPPEQVSSEQIEDVMSMLSEMGINIIEEEDRRRRAKGWHRRHHDGRQPRSCRIVRRDRKAGPHR